MPSDPQPQARIATKHGDDGTTGLLFGGRISKADLRVEAYGAVDEAISALGLARAVTKNGHTRTIIEGLQRHLFAVGAELATGPGLRQQLEQAFGVVTPAMTAELDEQLEALRAETDLPREFVIPGDSQASAAMDVARSVLRRAERRAVGLKDAGLLEGDELLRFLNRAGDLAFVLARHLDRRLPYHRARR